MSEDQAHAGIDIVVPCYQYGRFLRDCVTSVLTQGIPDVRVLIIDNASTDNSVEVAQQLAAEDPRVSLLPHRRNLGKHASFNEGIDWASSKYFMALCADDLLAPGSLARALSVLERGPDVGFAYGRAAYFTYPEDPIPVLDLDTNDKAWRIIAGGDFLERVCRTARPPSDSCGTVVRTDIQKLAGYYRPELPVSDDFEMWMRFARLGAAAVTDAIQGIRRLHEARRTAIARRAQYDDGYDRLPLDLWREKAAFESFFAHEGARLPGAARLYRLTRRGLAERAYWSALAHFCSGELGTSRDLFKFAFRHRPRTVVAPPISYLFRRADAAGRIIDIASEMVRRLRATAPAAQANR